jgi:hypothetical protein
MPEALCVLCVDHGEFFLAFVVVSVCGLMGVFVGATRENSINKKSI